MRAALRPGHLPTVIPRFPGAPPETLRGKLARTAKLGGKVDQKRARRLLTILPHLIVEESEGMLMTGGVQDNDRLNLDATLTAHVIQADDTGIRGLDETVPGGSKRGHMWCYLGDHGWASYVYTPTWSGDGPCAFLEGRAGWVQADAYAGYNALFSAPESKALEVGCCESARRWQCR